MDLCATPSPHLVRLMIASCGDNSGSSSSTTTTMILSKNHYNYKEQVSLPRRTLLDLALELGVQLSLEEVLYNLPPLQPRCYSIASSPLRRRGSSTSSHRSGSSTLSLLLTYRPVRYLTSRGVMREGTCTSYMHHLTPAPVLEDAHDDYHGGNSMIGSAAKGSTIAGLIRSNPSFRLPADPQTSIVLIAGGCGVAPIRAFLEERLLLFQYQQEGQQQQQQPPLSSFGPALLFVGFRDMDDVVYTDLIEQCLLKGVLTEADISCARGRVSSMKSADKLVSSSMSWSRGNVTEALHQKSHLLWNHFEQGGHTYLCGGTRGGFGAAVETQMIDIIQSQGNLSTPDAKDYLANLVAQGRMAQDLSD